MIRAAGVWMQFLGEVALDATGVPTFERFRDLQILDLEPQDRLDATERLPEPRQTQNLQLTAPVQRLVVLASCKPTIQTFWGTHESATGKFNPDDATRSVLRRAIHPNPH